MCVCVYVSPSVCVCLCEYVCEFVYCMGEVEGVVPQSSRSRALTGPHCRTAQIEVAGKAADSFPAGRLQTAFRSM